MALLPEFAYPGLTIGSTTTHQSGAGTHIHGTQIQASLAGKPIAHSPEPSSSSTNIKTKSSINTKPTLSIQSHPSNNTTSTTIPSRQISRHNNSLPSINAVVLARVTRLSARQANLAICVVSDAPCADDFAGVIRREDVRGWEIDRVRVEEAFRVGDVVRAVVISLGDQSSYYLSTARNELGVLLATSEAGNQMYPISWQRFRDPVTGKEEVRKVAKPV